MKNMLVTGGAGFIGANFVNFCLQHYPQINLVVLDALTYAGNKQNLQQAMSDPRFTFVEGNICDITLVESLLAANSIDTLVHFAAESHVDRSITGPDAFIESNILGTYTLLKSARKIWKAAATGLSGKKFHHVSTDEVYGTLGPLDPAFSETTPYAPNSPYAASKAASDHLVRAWHHTYGLPVTTSNCSNNYGPLQFPEKLIPLCLLNILNGKALPIYGDGRQIRDWLFVDDHSRGIALILEQGLAGETWNIGGNNEWANIDTVKLLCDIVDRLCQEDPGITARFPACPAACQQPCAGLISFVRDRPGHDVRYAIDAGKITRELNYRPQVDFEQGLTATVRWYLDNETWWRAVQDGSYRSKGSRSKGSE
ncbi:MAG: dTDP-glucose 4,6-dehydratase [Pseudomonadales bacterium]|nr:dTDP-glucose 4,6-dehydratase [Pseudomonadales bacterium]